MEVECEGDYQFGTPASGPTLHRPEYSPGGFQAELRNSKGLYNSDELLIRARQLAMADNIRELEKVHLLCNFPLEVYIHKEFTLTRSLTHTVSHPLSHPHPLSIRPPDCLSVSHPTAYPFLSLSDSICPTLCASSFHTRSSTLPVLLL